MSEFLFLAGVRCKSYAIEPDNLLSKWVKSQNYDWNLNTSFLPSLCHWAQPWKLTQASSLLQEMSVYIQPGNRWNSGKLHSRIYNPREFCTSKTCYERLLLCKFTKPLTPQAASTLIPASFSSSQLQSGENSAFHLGSPLTPVVFPQQLVQTGAVLLRMNKVH